MSLFRVTSSWVYQDVHHIEAENPDAAMYKIAEGEGGEKLKSTSIKCTGVDSVEEV